MSKPQLLQPETHYRRHGVRTIGQMTSMPLDNWQEASLPLGSILHCWDPDMVATMPDPGLPLFLAQTKPTLLYRIDELSTEEGVQKRVTVQLKKQTDDFLRMHHHFRILRDLSFVDRDPHALVAINYCSMQQQYVYARHRMASYRRWKNTWNTIVDRVISTAAVSTRQHYIQVGVPRPIPSVMLLNKMQDLGGISMMSVDLFSGPSAYLAYELWCWLSKQRQPSIFNKIDPAILGRVNLLFVDEAQWFVVNLGVLNSLRKDPNYASSLSIKLSRGAIEPHALQRRMLLMYMATMEATALANGEQSQTQVYNKDAQIDDDEAGEDPKLDSAELKAQDQLLDEMMARQQEAEAQAESQSLQDDDRSMATILATQAPEPEHRINKLCDVLLSTGAITAARHAALTSKALAYKTIQVGEMTMEKAVDVKPEELAIRESSKLPALDTIADQSMLEEPMKDYVRRYAKEIHPRRQAQVALSIQNAGYAVTGYSTRQISDVMGDNTEISINVLPVVGEKGAPLKILMPTLSEDGSYRSNGSTYRLRALKCDAPIVKLSPNEVGLSSGYGSKLFVVRGRTPSSSWTEWLKTSINASVYGHQTPGDPPRRIKLFTPGDVFDRSSKACRAYTAMSQFCMEMVVDDWRMQFDISRIEKWAPAEVIGKAKRVKMTVLGKHLTREDYLMIDRKGEVFILEAGQTALTEASDFESFIGLNPADAPVEFAEMNLGRFNVPMGVIMSYYMGLGKLIRLLNVTPRRVPANARKDLSPWEYELIFRDETLIFDRRDVLAALFLGGLRAYRRTIALYDSATFDSAPVFTNVFHQNHMGVNQLEELTTMDQMFIDPITREILEEMGEPQQFQGLLIRAVEMLTYDTHRRRGETETTVLRGNQQMVYAMYATLVGAVKAHKRRPDKARQPLTIDPFAVSRRIAENSTKLLCDQISPFQYLKEIHMTSAMGDGGQSLRTLVSETREFGDDMLGVIGENTTDDGKTGAVEVMSICPNLTNLNGRFKKQDPKTIKPGKMWTLAYALSPYLEFDDSKRANFAGIQRSHGIACEGYVQNPIKVGGEAIIPMLVSEDYAVVARQPGKVTEVTKRAITVTYKDGTTASYPLSTWHGAASGMRFPHSRKTDLKEGQEFKAGDGISYHPGFFEPEFFDPKRLSYKDSLVATFAFQETRQTFEDACVIGPWLAGKMVSPVTEIRDIEVSAKFELLEMAQPEQSVQYHDPLCLIQDPLAVTGSSLSDAAHAVLADKTKQMPKARAHGKIERIEVYYRCKIEDMSESLMELAKASDRQRAAEAKDARKPVYTGQVDAAFRVGGNPLPEGSAVVRVFIITQAPMGHTDKLVLYNQMKSVVSGYDTVSPKTEDGRVIHGRFSHLGEVKRIVESPDLIGAMLAVLEQIGARAVMTYDGQALPAAVGEHD